MKFSIWIDADDDTTLVAGTDAPKFADGTDQAPAQTLVKIFDAPGWDDAVREMHRYHESRAATPSA